MRKSNAEFVITLSGFVLLCPYTIICAPTCCVQSALLSLIHCLLFQKYNVMAKFSDPPVMWMERAATSMCARCGRLTCTFASVGDLRADCDVNGQVCLESGGMGSMSMVTLSARAVKPACGSDDARRQSRPTQDSWTTW